MIRMAKVALILALLGASAALGQTTPVRVVDPNTGTAAKVMKSAPVGTEAGLVVRTVGGAGGGVAQLQVYDGTAWDNVSQAAQSATVAHVPVAIQGSGVNIIEPLNAAPAGTEYALPVRTVGGGGGGTSSSFGAAFPATGTAAGAKVVSTPPTYTAGNMEGPTLTTDGSTRTVIGDGFGNKAAIIDSIALAVRSTPSASTSLSTVFDVLNESILVDTTGIFGATLHITAVSAPNLTIVAENSADYGTTWVQGPGFVQGDGSLAATLVNPAAGIYEIVSPFGAQDVRVRVSAYTSGSVTGYLAAGYMRGIKDGLRPAMDAAGRRGYQQITDGTDVALVSAAGALLVDASATTQPVSGTVAATQSGTWTVQPGNTANTTAWLTTSAGEIGNLSTASSGLSTATTLTQLVAASGSNRTLVKNWKCSASVASTATADQQCTLKYGTGTDCGTGTTYLDGCFQGANGGCNGGEIVVPASQALCWIHAAAGSKIVTVTYRQVP